MPMRNWLKQQLEAHRLPSVNLGTAMLIAVLLLCTIGLIPSRTAQEPPLSQVDSSGSILLRKGCQVMQHLTYLPCGHELTRRETLPAALIGKTRDELEAAYSDWRVTSFSADEVQMSQQLALHCPQHVVLKSDESGLLCVWQNTYGDALSLNRELNIPVSDFPDDVQQQLQVGLGFDTMEALQSWLESAES